MQTLPAKTSISCHLAHAFGPGYITQGSCDNPWITILKCSFQISCNIISSGEVCCWVPDCCSGFSHLLLLEISSKVFCETNIFVLRILVAACKQNDDGISLFCQIDPIAGAEMDAQL